MAKVIERNVPIAEENVSLSGQPATNMYEDFSEEMAERAEIPSYGKKNEPQHTEKDQAKRLKEMEKIVEEDIKGSKS